ncbi:MAG TPA: Hpt domain-containing protein [Blastocatellia bacterium]|nr:Hpt domain-containing protein [Blastocatellia bacterium]
MSNQTMVQEIEKVLDIQALMAIVDGDTDFLQNIVEVFLETYEGQIVDIREAIAHRNSDKLYKSAHSLKGALGAIYAKAAFESAMQLEIMGRTESWTDVDQKLKMLEHEVELLKPALNELSSMAL